MAQTGKLGAADSLLGNLLPAFAGAAAALPSTAPRTAVLGTSGTLLAQVILDLDDPSKPKVFCLSATNTLTIADSAQKDADLLGHPSPRWVLGGQDAQLGGLGLDFSGTNATLPATGARSGKLGVALGELIVGSAGETTPKVFNLLAQSILTLADSVQSGASLVGHPSPRWVLGGQDSYLGNAALAFVSQAPRPTTGTFTGVLGTLASCLANVRLALGEEEGDSSVKTWTVAATSTLTLSATATVANFSRSVQASSTLTLATDAVARTARPVTGASAIALADTAGFSASRAVVAESTISLSDSAALFPWTITEVSAESALTLTGVATGRHTRFYPAAASVIELGQSAESSGRYITEVSASSAVALTSEAAGRHAHFHPTATSSLDLLASSTGRHSHFRPIAVSTLELSVSATGRHAHFTASAVSAIELAQTAHGGISASYEVTAESAIELVDDATGRHASFRPIASSTIELTDSLGLSKVLNFDVESAIQVTTEEYDPDLNEIVTTIAGLLDAAGCARVSNQRARSVVPLTQAAVGYPLRSSAIAVSAESTIELADHSWKNETGEAQSQITLLQSAVAHRANPTVTAIELTDTAGVSIVRNRTAVSTLELKQSVSFSLARSDVAYQYRPFIGEGATDAPTPPSATLAGPLTGITDSLRLVFPATGTVTDSVVLRAPNLGNKDKLSFNRIARETRGGTLVVFADPIWPKIQTLALTFSGLSANEKDDILAFFDTHLGQEIGLLDWEHRYWRGVIMTPDDPVVQDTRDTFSASFEFEGELDMSWTP